MSENNEVNAVNEVKEYVSFDDMGIPDDLLRGVYAYGFEKPSEIQRKAIVPIINGHDVIAQAQSGSGKTGTFTISTLSRIDISNKNVQVICLVPTRELAQQIQIVAATLGKWWGLVAYAAVGKTPLRDDMRALENGVHFLTGTPGRIYDLMNRKCLVTNHVKNIIVDEADQMLENRFREQMQCILNLGFPPSASCALFSATMSEEVVEFANELLENPVRILIKPEEVRVEAIRQYRVDLDREDWKFDVLLDLYRNLDITQALIYCNKRQKAEWLSDKMMAAGFPITCIHGDMDVKERMDRMTAFRKGDTRVMISTDLLARGIDVQQISLVINYEMPTQMENYIHRIGRSGRYGRKGTAINLISNEDRRTLSEVERYYKVTIHPLPEDLSSLSLG